MLWVGLSQGQVVNVGKYLGRYRRVEGKLFFRGKVKAF